MKKVAIYGQSYSISAEKEIHALLNILEEKGCICFIEKKFYDTLKRETSLEKEYDTFKDFDDLNSTFEVMFTIGGDGTILRAVTYIRNLNIPILGINAGRLGFLATIHKDAIQENIDLIFKGAYTIQERSLLSVKNHSCNRRFFRTEFCLKRSNNCS